MPHCPASSGAPHCHARMISGLPRPAIFGSASVAPASASFFISGSGLISLLSGMKPETMVPGAIGKRKSARRNRLGRRLAHVRRQRIAPRGGVAAEFGFLRLDERRSFRHVRFPDAAQRRNGAPLIRDRRSPKRSRFCGAPPQHDATMAARASGKRKECGAAPAVGALIPGTYISRWAPCDRTHELGQGQLPSGS